MQSSGHLRFHSKKVSRNKRKSPKVRPCLVTSFALLTLCTMRGISLAVKKDKKTKKIFID